jgi:hypothetical protein
MGTLTSTANHASPGLVISGSPSMSTEGDEERTATGIQADVNPNVVLSAALGVDFSQSGAVSAQQLVTEQEGELDDVNDLKGTNV